MRCQYGCGWVSNDGHMARRRWSYERPQDDCACWATPQMVKLLISETIIPTTIKAAISLCQGLCIHICSSSRPRPPRGRGRGTRLSEPRFLPVPKLQTAWFNPWPPMCCAGAAADDGDFQGGGTWFQCLGPEGKVVDAEMGHAVAFAGPLRHAGYPISAGTRFILVLFM